MTRNFFRICTTVALSFAASQMILPAQDRDSLHGVWDVKVTVKDCQTGVLIRKVHSLQMFLADGSETETAATATRGISVGSWKLCGGRTYDASYWFFRYKPDGTFASTAKVTDTITLSPDGDEFTSAGKVEDFDATNKLISTGCFTHTATRLTDPD